MPYLNSKTETLLKAKLSEFLKVEIIGKYSPSNNRIIKRVERLHFENLVYFISDEESDRDKIIFRKLPIGVQVWTTIPADPDGESNDSFDLKIFEPIKFSFNYETNDYDLEPFKTILN